MGGYAKGSADKCDAAVAQVLSPSATPAASKSVLRGHVISFLQDGPSATARALARDELFQSMELCFVGPDNEVDVLAKRALHMDVLQVRTRT